MMDLFAKALRSDPEGAAVLMDHVAIAVGMDLIEADRTNLSKALLGDFDERIRLAKAGLGRGYISKTMSGEYPDQDMVSAAQWLAAAERFTIDKADTLETWYSNGQTQRRRVLRDALGRFATVGSGGQQPIVGSTADESTQLYAPVSRRARVVNGVVTANVEREAKNIDTWHMRAKNAQSRAGQWKDRLGASAGNAEIEFAIEGSDRRPRASLNDIAEGQFPSWMDTRYAISAMRLVPSASASEAEADSYDRIGGLSLFGRLVGDQKRNAALFDSRGEMSRTKATLVRLGIIGDLLKEGDATRKYGEMAALVGSLGPEAADVLGPHVRRTAYRYRGTERTLDQDIEADLSGDAGSELDAMRAAIDDGNMTSGQIAAKIKTTGPDLADPMMQAAKYRGEVAPDISGEALAMGVRSDLAAAHLLKTLPKNAIVGELSRESGHVLPSQGILIDADGDPISQSVGFGEDHYLPFNLKTMGRSHGGQYIRTRQQGGLTGEDIFASILHGVRSATVASSSGVFRLEFAPDFRGARGNSDKAFAMTERYLKILNTLQQEGMYSLDLPSAEQSAIWAQMRNNRRFDSMSDKELRSSPEYREQLNLARRKKLGEVDPVKLKATVEEEVKAAMPQATAQQLAIAVNERFTERYNEELDSRVKTLNLNGEGYALALQTLQAQFPYFIRTVEHEPLRGNGDSDARSTKDSPAVFQHGRANMGFFARRGIQRPVWLKQSRGADMGYVQPGSLTRAENRSSTPAPAAGQAPAATGAGGAPPDNNAPSVARVAPVDGATAPRPQAQSSPNSAPARLAATQGRLLISERDNLIEQFVNQMSAIVAPIDGGSPDRYHDGPEFQPLRGKEHWDELQGLNNKAKFIWLLSATSPDDMKRRFDEAGDDGFEALANSDYRNQFKAAVSAVFTPESLLDVARENEPFGTRDPDEMVEAMRQLAISVAEYNLLSDRFVSPGSIDTTTSRVIDFPDITAADSKEKVQAYAAANQELAAVAERLGIDENDTEGNVVRRFGAVSRDMATARAALDRLVLLSDPHGVGNEAGMYIQADTDAERNAIVENFFRMHGLDLASTFFTPLGIEDKAERERIVVSALEGDQTEISDLWEKLQRGRTLLEVSRVYGLAEGGGDRSPKVLLWKAQPRLRRSPSDPIRKAAASRLVAMPYWMRSARAEISKQL